MIKSQKDVVDATKASKKRKEDDIRKIGEKTTPAAQSHLTDPINSINKRLDTIEQYLSVMVPLIKQLENHPERLNDLDGEVSKLIGEIVRIIRIEDERYLEVGTVVNQLNEHIELLDRTIPSYVDKKIKTYFEGSDEELLDQPVDDKPPQ